MNMAAPCAETNAIGEAMPTDGFLGAENHEMRFSPLASPAIAVGGGRTRTSFALEQGDHHEAPYEHVLGYRNRRSGLRHWRQRRLRRQQQRRRDDGRLHLRRRLSL